MKTEGISLVSTAQTGFQTGTASGTKTGTASFDSYMNNQTQKVKSSNASNSVQTASNKPSKDDYVKISDNKNVQTDNGQEFAAKQPFTENKVASVTKNDSSAPEEVDTTAFENQMVAALSQMFGMSEEEITDILEQSGLDVSSLLFQIQPDDTVSLVNVDALQQLVMDVHGVEDKSAFLTNDLLSGELSQLTDLVKELGAEALGVEPEELSQIEQSVMLSFSEQFAAATENEGATTVIQNEVSFMADSVSRGNEVFNEVNAETEQDSQEGVQVIVENYKNLDETGNQMQNDAEQSESQDSQTASGTQNVSSNGEQEHTDSTTAANLFAERLSEAFDGIADESVAEPDAVMRNIVEQVVRQVKIRVMPETTSMELQLNPASLGRVNLHVSSTGGVATATMIVENQVAKEALESQMITLKQSFEEQGLKVDAVEVTVSEFSLKKDQQGQAPNGGENHNSNRQFREDAGTSELEDTSEHTAQTVEARRDINSVVDYTA